MHVYEKAFETLEIIKQETEKCYQELKKGPARRAAGLCRPRRGRPADRGRAPPPVQCCLI